MTTKFLMFQDFDELITMRSCCRNFNKAIFPPFEGGDISHIHRWMKYNSIDPVLMKVMKKLRKISFVDLLRVVIKNEFFKDMSECPNKDFEHLFEHPTIGGGIFTPNSNQFISKWVKREVAKMKINFNKGGGAYYLTDMEYGKEPTEFMCLFSGEGGHKNMRKTVEKLHEQKKFNLLYEKYIYAIFEKAGNYREITMRKDGGWYLTEEGGIKSGGYTRRKIDTEFNSIRVNNFFNHQPYGYEVIMNFNTSSCLIYLHEQQGVKRRVNFGDQPTEEDKNPKITSGE